MAFKTDEGINYAGDVSMRGAYNATQGDWKGAVDPGGFWDMLFPKAPPDPLAQQLIAMSDQTWDYYKNTIQPIQDRLTREAISPRTVQENVEQAREDVGTQYANLPAAFQREMQGLGVSVTPEQQESFKHTAALNEGIASVSASNAARQKTVAQQRGILGI